MAKGADAASTFLAGVVAKLPPEDRARGQELIEQLRTVAGGAVVAAIGDGVVGQSELSRQLDALREQQTTLDATAEELEEQRQQQAALYERQTQWWTANQSRLEEADRMKRGVQPVPSGAPNPQPTPPGVLTEEVFNERMQGTTAGFLGFQRDQNKITREHFAKFGEVVELEPLLTHPRIAEVGLLGVYDLVHADRLKAHQEAAVKKHDDAVAAEAVRKFQEAHAQMPYPAPNGFRLRLATRCPGVEQRPTRR